MGDHLPLTPSPASGGEGTIQLPPHNLSFKELKILSRITVRARQLRQTQTLYEATLWRILRENKLPGFRFRRQHPVGRFIADFACPTAKLIIELDGNSHDERLEQDAERDRILSKLGWTTLRFRNTDLMQSPEGVWLEIEKFLAARSDSE